MKKLVLVSLLAGLTAAPLLANADEGAVRVRAGLGAVNFVSPSGSVNDPDLESTYAAVTVGGSYISAGGWFIDLGLRNSLSGEWNATEHQDDAFFYYPNDGKFVRKETTLTVGKAIGSGWSLFGGMQSSKMEISYPETVAYFPFTLDAKGRLVFLGVSKGLPIGSGSLSISGALGSYSQEFAGGLVKSDGGAGASLGLSFSYPFTNSLGMTVDVRGQSYTVEYFGESAKENVGSVGLALVGTF